MPHAAPMSTLHEEQQTMQQMLDLLLLEQGCLVKAEIDQLQALAEQKSLLVNQLARLAAQRHSALAEAGFAAREEGMDAWLAAGAVPDGAAQAWAALLQSTRDAKEANRLNGMLLNKQMAYTQGALNALRPPPQAGKLYGPSGQTFGGSSTGRVVIG